MAAVAYLVANLCSLKLKGDNWIDLNEVLDRECKEISYTFLYLYASMIIVNFCFVCRCIFTSVMGEKLLLEDPNHFRLHTRTFLCFGAHGTRHRRYDWGRGQHRFQWGWPNNLSPFNWQRGETASGSFPESFWSE